MRISAWRLAYTGLVAAMLPGFLAAVVGWAGLVSGFAACILIASLSVSIRSCLRALLWYRCYFSLLASGTLAAAFLIHAYPEARGSVGLGWMVASILIVLGFWPFMEEIHDRPMEDLKSSSP